MKTLSPMFLAGVLFLPLSAQAAGDTISGRTLQEHNIACVSKCTENKPARFCQKVCECVTEEIRTNWTATDYNDRSTTLEKSPGDEGVSGEMSDMARSCALRIQNAGN